MRPGACKGEGDTPLFRKIARVQDMILTCPSCGTRYQTDRARFIPSGHNVRCAKCAHVWFQPAPEETPEQAREAAAVPAATSAAATGAAATGGAAPPSAPSLSAARERTVPEREKRERRFNPAIIGAWAALVVIVAGILWVTVQYRQNIAELWPQTASLYAAIGMPVNVRGLAIEDLAYTQGVEDGQPVLSITGRIVNVTGRELAVPALHVSLSDAARHELYHWNFDAGVPTLKPGADSPFTTRLASPPAEARMVDVRFAQAGER